MLDWNRLNSKNRNDNLELFESFHLEYWRGRSTVSKIIKKYYEENDTSVLDDLVDSDDVELWRLNADALVEDTGFFMLRKDDLPYMTHPTFAYYLIGWLLDDDLRQYVMQARRSVLTHDLFDEACKHDLNKFNQVLTQFLPKYQDSINDAMFLAGPSKKMVQDVIGNLNTHDAMYRSVRRGADMSIIGKYGTPATCLAHLAEKLDNLFDRSRPGADVNGREKLLYHLAIFRITLDEFSGKLSQQTRERATILSSYAAAGYTVSEQEVANEMAVYRQHMGTYKNEILQLEKNYLDQFKVPPEGRLLLTPTMYIPCTIIH